MKSKFYLTEKLPPYIFAAISELKEDARSKGMEVVDFGMGNPDLSPPMHVKERLSELVQDGSLYGYSPSGGINDLKDALAGYYQRRFGADLSRDEVLVTIGAKEGIASLAQAITSEDEYVIVPNPSYPIHTFAFIIAHSKAVALDALDGEMFLTKIKEYVAKCQKNPIAIIVNYPCNPTTSEVDLDFYQRLVDFARENKIYIISDIAYNEIYFTDNKPPSILQIDGAKEVAVEFSSVSKSYSMAGCRVGFVAGNKDLISALRKVKAYLDYGSFGPLQMAAASALGEESDEYLDEIRQVYDYRGNFLIKLFKDELGWEIDKPNASMFLWAKIPEKFAYYNSFDFCKMLIEECGVAFSPGSSFGSNGDGYVRISLIHDDGNVKKAVAKLKELFDRS